MADPTAFGPTPTVGTGDFQAYTDRDYHTIDWTNNTGSDVQAGAIVVVGGVPMFSPGFIASTQAGSLVYLTTLRVKKDSSVFAQGNDVFWNATGSPVVGTASSGAASLSGGIRMGFAMAAALTGDAYVQVRLTPETSFGRYQVTTVAAAGSTVTDAGKLSEGLNIVTGADGTKGVVLPTAPIPGTTVIVKGTTSGTLKIWPDAAATINAIATNGAFTTGTVAPVTLVAASATQWYTLPLVAS